MTDMPTQLSLAIDPATPCQRWRNGRERYRPAGECIDPSRYGIEVLSERVARTFVETQHYARSYPAGRLACGLMETNGHGQHRLVGVAVFSVPMSNAIIPKYTGQPASAGVEIGRLVLLDEVPGNGESHFLGLAFRLLRQELPEIHSVIAYSDPVPRILENGLVLKPGHCGMIYKAHNGVYVGRGSSRTLVLARDGRVLSARTISKLRNDERGATGAYRQMLSMGAPKRRLGEPSDVYVRRAIENGPFTCARHAGNYCYAWPIGSRMARRRIVTGFAPRRPYPVEADAPIVLRAA